MKYIQALKEQGYNLKNLPTDIKKAVNLVLKSKDYNSKVEALDFITFNSIRNSQPVDERIEELHKLSLTDHSVEDNNGFNTPLSIEIAEEQFAENLEPVKAGTGMFVNGKELSIQEVIEETQREIDELEKQEITLQVHKEIMAKTKVLQRLKIQAEINDLIEKQFKTRNNYEYDKLEKQIRKLKAELQNKFASGGHIATKNDNNKVRNWKVRFHLGRGENFMNWKVENPKTKDVEFYKPDEVQLEMTNCKLTNSPSTAMKIFTGEIDKSPIAWVVCENVKVSKKIEAVDPDERLTYNPRTAPNWFDTDGKNVDNFVFEKLITFGRGVYYETPDGKLFALGGFVQEYHLGGDMSKHLAPNGKPSNLTHEQWHLVRTPEFKKWFGDWENDPENSSKVVDSNGEPMVVWHTTSNEFNVFSKVKSREGFFFAPQKDRLSVYGKSKLNSYFLNLRNPSHEMFKLDLKYLKPKGYDGVMDYGHAKHLGNESLYEIIAFEPNQIKLADGSNTNFDANKPDIRFDEGGSVKQTSPDIYENKLLQIRIIGGEPSYYKRVNQEWRFLSPDEVEKLKNGTKHELEHSATIEAFKRRDIPNETIASFIAYDHLNEDPNYYQKLDKAIPEKMAMGELIKRADGSYSQRGLWDNIRDNAGSGKQPTPEMLRQEKIIKSKEVEQLAEGKKIEEFPEVVLEISANNEYYRKANFTEKALIDVINQKVKFTELDTGSGNFRIAWKKVYENSNGYYIDYDYFGGRIFIDNWYWLCQENKPEKMAKGKKIDPPITYTYALTIRPFDIGTYPKENFVRFVEEEADNYKFGLLEYSAPLSDEDVRHYSLAPVSELLPYDAKIFDWYEGNLLQAYVKRTKGNIPYVRVYMHEKDLNEEAIEEKDLTGYEFLSKIKSGDYKLIEEQPRLKDTDGENHLNQHKQPTPEPTIQPTPALLKEEKPMAKTEDSNSGISVSNWNEVPVRWKNVRAVRPATINLNPFDKGFQNLVKDFTGDDVFKPHHSAINFTDSGVVCTDTHKLIHIKYKNSDFKGLYPSLNSVKAFGKSTSPETIEKEIKELKYANWEAVVPKDHKYVYEIDVMKLYQYVNVALNFSNKITKQVVFAFDKGKAIGFNGEYLIQSLTLLMKMQKCTKVYFHISDPNRAVLISYEKSITPTGNTYVLLMPVMLREMVDLRGEEKLQPLALSQVLGAKDIDFEKFLSCYFDFEDSEIHNADGTIAEYKESYGDANEMPLSLITMLDKFLKNEKSSIAILDSVCVDGNGIRVDSTNARILVANDYNLPNGIYTIENNAFVKNVLKLSVEDFPALTSKVPTNNPVFTMDAEAFKYYIQKASNHTGDDDLRPMLSSILFEYYQGGNLQIVSTDAHSLFHANIQKYASVKVDKNFSYPMGSVKQLLNFTKNIDSKEVKFYVDDDKNYRIDGGRIHFEAKIEDGKYPNWEAVTPKQYSNQLSFNIKDLFVCLNNEVSKAFAKNENLKLTDLSIYNQNDKIFLGHKPAQNQSVVSKEICEVKIKKETFETKQSFNPQKENYILLAPVTHTNGNYFNFSVEKLNGVMATIGKEKVIVDYNDLSQVYLFTSDNLDYKTSDIYKPEKAVTTPIKPSPVKPLKEKMQPSSSSTNFKTDNYGRLEPSASQLQMKNTPVPEMAQSMKNQIEILEKQYNLKYDKKIMLDWGYRYISLRRKIYPDYRELEKLFGKPLGSFNVGDIIGLTSRNSDDDRYVVLEKSKDKVYILPYAYAYPKVSESDATNNGWELIEPKQNLLVVHTTKKQPVTPPVSTKPKPTPVKDDKKELEQAIKGLEAFLFSFGATKTKANLEESLAVQSAIKGLKALLK